MILVFYHLFWVQAFTLQAIPIIQCKMTYGFGYFKATLL
jgi:hypothetical protein